MAIYYPLYYVSIKFICKELKCDIGKNYKTYYTKTKYLMQGHEADSHQTGMIKQSRSFLCLTFLARALWVNKECNPYQPNIYFHVTGSSWLFMCLLQCSKHFFFLNVWQYPVHIRSRALLCGM